MLCLVEPENLLPLDYMRVLIASRELKLGSFALFHAKAFTSSKETRMSEWT